jgi:hypothetical protein
VRYVHGNNKYRANVDSPIQLLKFPKEGEDHALAAAAAAAAWIDHPTGLLP